MAGFGQDGQGTGVGAMTGAWERIVRENHFYRVVRQTVNSVLVRDPNISTCVPNPILAILIVHLKTPGNGA